MFSVGLFICGGPCHPSTFRGPDFLLVYSVKKKKTKHISECAPLPHQYSKLNFFCKPTLFFICVLVIDNFFNCVNLIELAQFH